MAVTMENSPIYKRYAAFMKSVPKRARVVLKEIFDCTNTFTMKDVVLWSRQDLHMIAADLDIDADELDIAIDVLYG